MDERKAGPAVFQNQFVALVAGVGASLLMVQHDDLFKLFGNVEPKAERKRIGALEVSELVARHGILPAEQQRLAKLALYAFGRLRQFARKICTDEVHDFVANDFIE